MQNASTYILGALCFLSVLSCKEIEGGSEPAMSDYHAKVSVDGTVLVAGEAVFPTVSVSVDGPERYDWLVRASGPAFRSASFVIETGETASRTLYPLAPSLTEGNYHVELTVRNSDSGVFLSRNTFTVTVVRKDAACFTSLRLISQSGETGYTIYDGTISEPLALAKGEDGTLVLTYMPSEGDESIDFYILPYEASRLLSVERLPEGEGERGTLRARLFAKAQGEGTILFHLTKGAQSTSLAVPFTISDDITPPPGPVVPSPSVSLAVPDAGFSGKGFTVKVTTTGLSEDEPAEVVLYLDGNEVKRISPWLGSVEAPVILGADGSVKKGSHRVQAEIRRLRDDYSATSDERMITVHDMSLRWMDASGGACYYGLQSRDDNATFLLEIATSCPAALLSAMSLQEPSTGEAFARDKKDNKRFVVPKRSRGHHSLRLTVSVGTDEYSWDTDADCYDVWGISIFLSGNDLRGTLSGPGRSLPSRVWVEMSAVIGAYIPYTEATGTATDHYTMPKGKYIDIELYKRQYEFPMGSQHGTITLESGYVNNVIKYVRNKASSVTATKNGASHWVENSDGSWRKEYYTPPVYPSMTIGFWGTITGGQQRDFVMFDIDLSPLRATLENEGFHLRTTKPYWE